MRKRGEGVKKSQNFADVIYGWPLTHVFSDTAAVSVHCSRSPCSARSVGMQRVIYLSTPGLFQMTLTRVISFRVMTLFLSQYWMDFAEICVILKVLYKSIFGCIKWWFESSVESSVTRVITWWLWVPILVQNFGPFKSPSNILVIVLLRKFSKNFSKDQNFCTRIGTLKHNL